MLIGMRGWVGMIYAFYFLSSQTKNKIYHHAYSWREAKILFTRMSLYMETHEPLHVSVEQTTVQGWPLA